MLNVIYDTAKLKCSRFGVGVFRNEPLRMWDQITGISNSEHVPDVRLGKSCWKHSTVHATEEDGFWLSHENIPSDLTLQKIV